MTVDPSENPAITGFDSGAADDTVWRIIGSSDGTDGDMELRAQVDENVTDSNDLFIVLDGSAETITVYKNIVPNDDGTLDIGVQTTGQFANVWADAINGADYTYLNGWRTLESDKYDGYPKGIAIANTCFESGKVWDKAPEGCKPMFVITEDFIEYKGIRLTADKLEKLIGLIN